MVVTQAGVNLIKRFEGDRLTAYLCPAGKLTIGYGHTGPDVTPGKKITAEQANSLLIADIDRFAKGVRALVKKSITDNQFSACVSFAYNVGIYAFSKSTLLRLLNAGDIQGAANEFPKWNKANGKPLPGLTARRAAERALFLGNSNA